jgi:hypothetical protein
MARWSNIVSRQIMLGSVIPRPVNAGVTLLGASRSSETYTRPFARGASSLVADAATATTSTSRFPITSTILVMVLGPMLFTTCCVECLQIKRVRMIATIGGAPQP